MQRTFLGRFLAHVRGNVIAYAALFVALGGTGYAAAQFTLPTNSVGTKQLKNKAVTKPKLDPKVIKLFKGQKGNRGPQGPRGLQGSRGLPGALPASNNTSVSPSMPTSVADTDTTLMTTNITTTQQARIVANAVGQLHDSATTADSSCVVDITPQGGSTTAMGQRYDVTYITIAGTLAAPTPAGGAVVEPAGAYTITYVCKQIGGTAGGGDIKFDHGDLGVAAFSP